MLARRPSIAELVMRRSIQVNLSTNQTAGSATSSNTTPATPSVQPPAMLRRNSAALTLHDATANPILVFLNMPTASHKNTTSLPVKQPKLDERAPLSLFWHADENLRRVLRRARKGRASRPQVHLAQSLLLDSIFLVYNDLPEQHKLARNYRLRLSGDDQRELHGFCETVLFTAQALARGFRVNGIENNNTSNVHDLIDPAKALVATLDALRFVFRSRALILPQPPYQPLFTIIREFDAAWVTFETMLCENYINVLFKKKDPGFIDDSGLLAVLLSETVVRAIHEKYITRDQLRDFDPDLMFAIPRLAIVSAIVHLPDLVELTDRSRWANGKTEIIIALRFKLAAFSHHQITKLEWKLAKNDSEFTHISSSESSPSIDVNTDQTVIDNNANNSISDTDFAFAFTAVCAIADNFQSGRKARDFVSILQKAFTMNLTTPLSSPNRVRSTTEIAIENGAPPFAGTRSAGRPTSTSPPRQRITYNQ